jgi:hypothetical protein
MVYTHAKISITMNPKIPITLGVAGMLTGIATALASQNGILAGHPHLAYLFSATLVDSRIPLA